MRILGVDPGGTGALALLDGPGLVYVEDMPVFIVKRGKGNKPELNVPALVELLKAWRPEVVWFERVGGMDGQSASAAFNFGRVAGAAEGVARATGARFEMESPHLWKKEMRLTGKSKDDARAMATARWPAHAGDFRLKKHDGRAEAALIAEYGRRQLHKEGIFG